MARCACGNQTCSCVVQATPNGGITVSGNGSPTRPYQIGMAGGGNQLLNIKVADTPTLDLTLTGSGTSTDKLTILGNTLTKLTDLKDVADPEGPQTGDVPVWMGTHWEFKPPPSTPVGAISATHGIAGDGSGGNPLYALTSGVFGTAPLSSPPFHAATQNFGDEVYLDTSGNLRSRPQVLWRALDANALPSAYPMGVSVMSIGPENATGWAAYGTIHTIKRMETTSGQASGQTNQWWYRNNSPVVWYRYATSDVSGWSAWITVVDVDSGWVDITVLSGFAAQSTGERPAVRLKNGTVYVRGGWASTGITTINTGYTVGTIPAGYRPIVNIITRAGTPTGLPATGMRFNADGSVVIMTGANLSSYYFTGGLSWLTD